MNTYKISLTTRTGQFIETEITAKNMIDMLQSLVYQLKVEHRATIDDVVELDITELE